MKVLCLLFIFLSIKLNVNRRKSEGLGEGIGDNSRSGKFADISHYLETLQSGAAAALSRLVPDA